MHLNFLIDKFFTPESCNKRNAVKNISNYHRHSDICDQIIYHKRHQYVIETIPAIIALFFFFPFPAPFCSVILFCMLVYSNFFCQFRKFPLSYHVSERICTCQVNCPLPDAQLKVMKQSNDMQFLVFHF